MVDSDYALISRDLHADINGEHDDNEEDSPFTRLLALGPSIVPPYESTPSPVMSPVPTPSFRIPTSFVLIATSTLSALLLLFIWLALVGPVWFRIQLEAQTPFLDHTNISLYEWNLASLLKQLHYIHWDSMAIVLWSTSLVLPCLYTVFCPSWILLVTQQQEDQPKTETSWLRILLESGMPFALAAVYGLAILQSIPIKASWTDSQAGALVTLDAPAVLFGVGVTCALVSIALLRFHRYQEYTTPPATSRETATSTSSTQPLMRILEDDPIVPASSTTTPATTRVPPRQPRARFWHVLITFQCGLISILLWVPSLAFPLVQLPTGPVYWGTLLRTDFTTLVFAGLWPLVSTVLAVFSWRDKSWKRALYAVGPPFGTLVLVAVITSVRIACHSEGMGNIAWLVQCILMHLFWMGTFWWA